MVHVLTDATFEQETSQGLVLVDFWATWCGPCRMQAPILEQLAEEIHEDDLKIFKMDVDENPNTASQLRHHVHPDSLIQERWSSGETSCWCSYQRTTQSDCCRIKLTEKKPLLLR